MAQNQLLPFAHADDANVVSFEDWSSAEYNTLRQRGFQSGVAKSDEVNRAVAQGANVGYCVGELIKDYADETATLKHTALYSSFKKALENFVKRQVIGFIYPVGSIYTSTVSTNPAELFGVGTWVRIGEGNCLVDAGSSIVAGSTGGAAYCTLTSTELPAHSHSGNTENAGGHTPTATTSSEGVHSHSITVNNGGDHTHTGSTGESGNHTHTGSSSSAGGHTHSGTTGGGGSHGHSVSVDSVGGHAHTAAVLGNHYHGFGYNGDNTGWFFAIEGGETGRQWTSLSSMRRSGWNGRGGGGGQDCWNNLWGNLSTSIQSGDSVTVTTSNSGSHSHGASIGDVGDHTHGFTTGSSGGHTHSITANSAGNHTHSVSINSGGGHAHTASSANCAAHTHTVTCSPVSAHKHSFTTGSTGSGRAFSIRNPYLAVHIWKRVA